jgi:hypothetical protein
VCKFFNGSRGCDWGDKCEFFVVLRDTKQRKEEADDVCFPLQARSCTIGMAAVS